ncbi:MAG: exodeoxyribonuclease VII large subunit [Planctomycetota bacterium]
MVGMIDISPDGSCILISFPYREDLVSLVRNIPGRRWDRGSRVWKVPLEQVETAVKLFMSYGFSLSPQVATTLATDGKDTGPETLKLGKVDRDAGSLTISALNLRVAEVLNQAFQEPLWIVGELQNYKKGRRGKHRYFELVERDESEEDAPPRAVVSAAIFDRAWTIVGRRLKQKDQSIELTDGLKIRVFGRVDLYQPRGRYQFIIEDIDPGYTLGDLYVRREKVLAELEQLGLRQRQSSLEMPLVPLRIALVTSEDSDAFNDFVHTLAETRFNFLVTLYPVFVQGERLRPTVTTALSWFAEEAEHFDVLVIIRGGGSRSELGTWDDLEVAKAVAEHPLKAIIGIGHERDQCALDLLATSVKTPTAAAELIVERVQSYQRRVEDAMLELIGKVQGILDSETRELRQKAELMKQVTRAGLAGARSELQSAAARVALGAMRRIKEQDRVLLRALATLDRSTDRRIQRERVLLQNVGQRVASGSRRDVQREIERLEQRASRCRALDPVRVLARGFAILRHPSGKALRSVTDTEKKKVLEARLADGELELEVKDVRRSNGT